MLAQVRLEVLIGCEYECSNGHRFMASPATGPGRAMPHSASAAAVPLELLLASETPLTRPCAADGCGQCAQLQRLVVRTPDSAALLRLRPCVRFAPLVPPSRDEADARGAGSSHGRGAAGPPHGAGAPNTPAEGEHFFEASGSLLLPRDSLVSLRLPYVYADGSQVLLTLATAAELSNARKGVLLPHWLIT